MNILITGGCGFVGSNLAIYLSDHIPDAKIQVLDNLSRKGSELNIIRLRDHHIHFVKGDVRNDSDFDQFEKIDVLIDAAAEPSVMAGLNHDPKTLIDINFGGTIQCLEQARKWKSVFIYLSSSRVYPYRFLNQLPYFESPTRYDFMEDVPYYKEGINECFPTNDLKSFYGSSKYASEQFIREYSAHYGIPSIINRFGVIAGPWQMGKVDQGFLSLWVAAHYFKRPLQYIGFGGAGKQVRDVLHIADLCEVVTLQIKGIEALNGALFNIGGGWSNTVSLLELTKITQAIVGHKIDIREEPKTRSVDVRIYYTDNKKIKTDLTWQPKKDLINCVEDTFNWIRGNEKILAKIL